MSFWNPVPSPNARQVFAVGGQIRGELVRFDVRSHQLQPFLSGISAEQLDFSRDGEWVTYTTFPEGILWKSRLDGSERTQLTAPPLRVDLPRWSPDGTRIAFSGYLARGPREAYVLSVDGGKLERVSKESPINDCTWSANGNALICSGLYSFVGAQSRIFSVDLQSGRVSAVPESDGLFSPRASPDGRYIAAMDWPGHSKFYLFDSNTQKWSLLADAMNTRSDWPQWSPDGAYLYFADNSKPAAKLLYRVGIKGRKLERIASIEVPQGLAGYFGNWMSAAPDGSALLLRNVSIHEIYALDVDLP